MSRAKISPCGCSRPLQRAIVDFAADQPFAQARAKLREHYGFEIGESTEAMLEAEQEEIEFPEAPGSNQADHRGDGRRHGSGGRA